MKREIKRYIRGVIGYLNQKAYLNETEEYLLNRGNELLEAEVDQ